MLLTHTSQTRAFLFIAKREIFPFLPAPYLPRKNRGTIPESHLLQTPKIHVDMNSDAKDRSPAPSGDRNGSEDVEDAEHQRSTHNPTNGDGAGPAENGQKPSSNAKDPSRPRRKKARRACFACQRAHLTCGASLSLSSEMSRLTVEFTVARLKETKLMVYFR